MGLTGEELWPLLSLTLEGEFIIVEYVLYSSFLSGLLCFALIMESPLWLLDSAHFDRYSSQMHQT